MKPPSRPHPGSASLPFSAPQHPADVYTANVDGAARGNPGPASYACIVRAPDGSTAWQIGKYIGRTTNNVAEYYGLIAALDYATAQGIARLRVISDSELMVKQMKGQYRVKSPDLQPLYERAKKLARGLAFFAIEHVRRERNSDADALANVALDRTSSSGYSPAAGSTSGVSAPPDLSMGGSTPSAASAEAESASSASPRPSPERPATAADDMRLARVAREALSGADDDARAANSAAGARAPREQRVKARYADGALHPLDPLDLAEGETVELRIRKK